MNGREKNVPVSGKSSGRSRHGRYNPFYFIWLALQSMWRNRIMSIASVLILTSCLILLGCFGMIFQNLNSNLLRLRNPNRVLR